ncbi:Transposon Tf2-11 polyprotein, partial [Linum grandiflorum]
TNRQSERTIQTLEELLRSCILEFDEPWIRHLPLVEFAYNNSYHSSIDVAPFKALYGRKCRTPLCWDEAVVRFLIGPQIVQEATDRAKQIHARLATTQNWQKQYADGRTRELSFMKGDKVYLMVLLWKGLMCFIRKGKLASRFIGLYTITRKIRPLAYELALPRELDRIHNVFHVSMLQRYISRPDQVVILDEMDLELDLIFLDRPVSIIYHQIRQLRNKQIPMLKVLSRNQESESATWETEAHMRDTYPYLVEHFFSSNAL